MLNGLRDHETIIANTAWHADSVVALLLLASYYIDLWRARCAVQPRSTPRVMTCIPENPVQGEHWRFSITVTVCEEPVHLDPNNRDGHHMAYQPAISTVHKVI